jgi:hypothetical protein
MWIKADKIIDKNNTKKKNKQSKYKTPSFRLNLHEGMGKRKISLNIDTIKEIVQIHKEHWKKDKKRTD